MPKIDKGFPVDVSIRYREGIEEVTPEEMALIEANLPELLKILQEEMDTEEG